MSNIMEIWDENLRMFTIIGNSGNSYNICQQIPYRYLRKLLVYYLGAVYIYYISDAGERE